MFHASCPASRVRASRPASRVPRPPRPPRPPSPSPASRVPRAPRPVSRTVPCVPRPASRAPRPASPVPRSPASRVPRPASRAPPLASRVPRPASRVVRVPRPPPRPASRVPRPRRRGEKKPIPQSGVRQPVKGAPLQPVHTLGHSPQLASKLEAARRAMQPFGMPPLGPRPPTAQRIEQTEPNGLQTVTSGEEEEERGRGGTSEHPNLDGMG